MGIAQFDATIKKYIIDKYEKQVTLGGLGTASLKKLAPDIADSKTFRKAFTSGASGHDSIITVKGLEDLGQKLADSTSKGVLREMAQELFSKIDFNIFITWLKTRADTAGKKSSKSKIVITEFSGGLKLENITQANAKEWFQEYLYEILDKSYTKQPRTVKRLKEHIASNIQAGHLAGIFSLKFKLALGAEATGLEKAKNYRDFTLSLGDENKEFANALDVIIKSLLDADFLTSNVVDKEDLFLVAVKYALGENPRLQTELQFGKDNGDSGSLLGSAGKSIKALITNITTTSATETSSRIYFRDLLASLENLQKAVEANAKRLLETDPKYAKLATDILTNNATLQNLIETKGSPSIIDGIATNIATVIKTGKILKEVKTETSVKKTRSKKDPISRNLNTIIKETVKKVKIVRTKIAPKTSGATRLIQSKPLVEKKTVNLVQLQALLDGSLQDRIKANMGTGTRRDILNLRSGRFAESVKVERLSESRAGMITAFYSYMKNPYATFSTGGLQGSPKTRDPKLLIAKSIRELAIQQVQNRLRSVAL